MLTRNCMLCVAPLVLLPTAPAAAWQAVESRPPISVDNAERVQPVNVIEQRVDRLSRGPEAGQWLIETRVFSPTDRFKQTTELVDAEFQTIRTIAAEHDPRGVVFHPDGERIAFTQRDSGSYVISDLDGGNAVSIEIGDSPGRAAFSPDGELLAIGHVYWDPNVEGAGYSEVRLFDIDGNLIRTFERNGAGAIRPVFSPDGRFLAAGNRNYETQVFEVATGRLLHEHRKRMTQEHAFSPDGSMIAEGTVDGGVYIWNTETGELLNFASSGCEEIYSVDWSPQGDVLATSGRGGDIILWDPRDLSKLSSLEAPYWVVRVRFSSDGTQIVTSSSSEHSATADRRVTIWAVADEE